MEFEVFMSRRAMFFLPLLLVPIIIGGIAGGLWFLLPRVAGSAPAAQLSAATDRPASVQTEAQPLPTLNPEQTEAFDAEDRLLTLLYQERSPAVVAIRVQGNDPNANQLPFDFRGPDGSPIPLPSDPDGAPPLEPEFNFESAGSGFLLDDQGHIVTNNHVIENAEVIEVSFTSGLTVEAEIVGTDADSDIAVLKVEQIPEGVQPLPLGDSKQVLVGQRAIAIGNPFSLNTTLTVGVVSARGRTLQNRAIGTGFFSIADVIQTDAAINPGNSGGPLFNSRGEVIGVNTAIRSEGGAFEGVGFAVPSNTVDKVARALIEKGVYEHPYLGISFFGQPLTTRIARELNLPVNQGAIVSGVSPDGPAENAGIRAVEDDDTGKYVTIDGVRFPDPAKHDIILRINDRTVTSSEDVIDYLATDTEVGQTVTLTVLRDGQEQQVEVTLGARPRPE
jgi:S1-C subfamily serine protease